ncbi:Ig-like domain-containing protein [Microbacterium sp. ZW T5_45]|uniref:Ig-like domain-containing protein n=1 Tax=Microbacterium sp. ZW T5_45 TaxID=3378080 RepID=UPI0038542B6C
MRTPTRRVRRRAFTALGVAALTTVALLPSVAVAESDPELLGEPTPYLIESVSASGKVLEIGNPNAQTTVPENSLAAAAVFPLAKTPAELQAQAVLAYPVEGASSVVLTNDDGQVLVRRGNDDANFRYLTIPGLTLDEAAANPLAQWNISDAGNGASYLRNAQTYANGAPAGLDMYNWKTDTGSEVQTYDAGTADVQKWKLHRLEAQVAPLAQTRVDAGAAPAFPASLTGRYSWGLTTTLTPTWSAPDAAIWNTDGIVTVEGTAAGLFGEAIPVTAEYLVGSLGSAADAAMTGYVGISLKELQMHAPTTVERTVSGSDTTVTASVTWDWSVLTEASTATEGVLEVPATAATGFDARLLITIAPAEIVNVLRDGGIHYDYTHLNGTSFGLLDGNRNAPGFDDWRSGGAANRVNPNTVSFYFDQPRQLTGAAVFDNAGRQNIGGVTVQYRDLIGGWIDMPSEGGWPYVNPSPNLNLEFTSTPVLATGMRVVITNKTNDNWMSLSEVEAYGPALAG